MASNTLVIFSYFLVAFIIVDRVRYLSHHKDFKMFLESEHEVKAQMELFVDYMRKFNKTYQADEFPVRFKHFKKNLSKIRKLNQASHATYGVTKFSDWFDHEFSQMLSPVVGGCRDMAGHCRRPRQYGKPRIMKPWMQAWYGGRFPHRGRFVPARWDWRDYNAVGRVLDQKLCPVCWAFSMVGVMESMASIQGYGFTRLSIQNLIDCSFDDASEKTGCRHGRPMVDVFQFLCHGDGRRTLATEADYPLTLDEEECKSIQGIRSLKKYVYSCDMNETALVEAVSRGPVTAVINAAPLINYIEGVVNENCEVTPDALYHAVQIVGYDSTAVPPYYIVRNSWGEDWGEKGYMRLGIGGNQCGIASTVGQLEVY